MSKFRCSFNIDKYKIYTKVVCKFPFTIKKTFMSKFRCSFNIDKYNVRSSSNENFVMILLPDSNLGSQSYM